jgi:hypothetical protein
MVTDFAEFKAAREAKEVPLVSRRRAGLTAGALYTVLCDAERSDLLATMRFDLTPDDMTALEGFIFHLNHRIEDRQNRHDGQRNERTEDQRNAPGA